MGYKKYLELKPNILPKNFDCQVKRPVAHTSSKVRSLIKKRKHKELLDAALDESEIAQITELTEESGVDLLEEVEESGVDLLEEVEESGVDVLEGNLPELLGSYRLETEVSTPNTESKCTQTKIKSKNKKSQCDIKKKLKNKSTNTDVPSHIPKKSVYSMVYSSLSESSESSSDEDFNCDPDLNISEVSYPSDTELDDIRSRENMMKKIKEKPLTFLGLPPESMFVCEKLSNTLKIDLIFVFICLVKIRLDLSFDILSSLFAYSSSHLARIYNNNIRGIGTLLNSLVYWPDSELVRIHLPLPFRLRYKTVYCIIDCLEIEIQKSSDPQFQAATWSEYKKCNTAKYLISCTPQGLINFVSIGYGGRITDNKIIQESGFLNHLQSGMSVMADRGFKNVDALFLEKGCSLVRPPSVYVNIKPTKEEVKETKNIASLRIIIENVIGRIRHFKLLAPHACVPVKNFDQLDYAVQSACGLINLQNPVRQNNY
ncbi:uncharacterized protein LOC103510695 isoform X2 [Diaphorina citri]|nr:uncharacterized protein LOC103510695 isoform X2 [Diaphorina citri]